MNHLQIPKIQEMSHRRLDHSYKRVLYLKFCSQLFVSLVGLETETGMQVTSGYLTPDTRTKSHGLQTALFFGQNFFSQRMRLHLNHNDVGMLTFLASVGASVLSAKLQRKGLESECGRQKADEKYFKNIF